MLIKEATIGSRKVHDMTKRESNNGKSYP